MKTQKNNTKEDETTMEDHTRWELVNPEGIIRLEQFTPNPHPATLEGKTVLLRWNGKHNGDLFLNRIGEFLTEHVKNVNIIKSWEVAPETKVTSSNPTISKEIARKLAAYRADMVIGAQGD